MWLRFQNCGCSIVDNVGWCGSNCGQDSHERVQVLLQQFKTLDVILEETHDGSKAIAKNAWLQLARLAPYKVLLKMLMFHNDIFTSHFLFYLISIHYFCVFLVTSHILYHLFLSFLFTFNQGGGENGLWT